MSEERVEYGEQLSIDICDNKILDSGNRTEFSTGAVRDMREGKGRCDLLPLDVTSNYFTDPVLLRIYQSIHGRYTTFEKRLYSALAKFIELNYDDPYTAFLELSKHFEDGAKKYGEYNWQKGIPLHCYIDSAVRHYLKFKRGDKDEPHDRAFMWNIVCAIWTHEHKPEMNDLGLNN